jgi:hypothetical protein
MPFVSMPFDLTAEMFGAGMSSPIAATMAVRVNMHDASEANVAAPPNIRSSTRNGVRVVSSAMVPKTVSMAKMQVGWK